MVVKHGSQWAVKSSTGKVLSTHGTKKDAVAQLRAVEYFKKHPRAKR